MKLVAFVTDQLAVTRILDHLGLSPPRDAATTSDPRITTAPVDDEGRELPTP